MTCPECPHLLGDHGIEDKNHRLRIVCLKCSCKMQLPDVIDIYEDWAGCKSCGDFIFTKDGRCIRCGMERKAETNV